MFIKEIFEGQFSRAGDETFLGEMLHPKESGDLKIRYSLALAILPPGQASLPHRLKTSSEVYYILEGEGRMSIEEETAPVHPGQAVYIPPGARQSIRNTGPSELKFLCIVDPAWRAEDEEVLAVGEA